MQKTITAGTAARMKLLNLFIDNTPKILQNVHTIPSIVGKTLSIFTIIRKKREKTAIISAEIIF
ncbi:hypothetical protein FACS189427_10040 [Planctomycetales bacterium]|nr:hypothetical protein FACS189427_10040 [Planctomycetales bacterium]